MLLYEFEGKKLFASCGIGIPKSQLIESPEELDSSLIAQNDGRVVLKAQVLSGKRADAGGIVKVTQGVISSAVKDLFKTTVNNEKVERILVEEAVEEVFLSALQMH